MRPSGAEKPQEDNRVGLTVALGAKALVSRKRVVAVADRAYASLKLLDRCRKQRKPITFITRLRLDSALYEPAPPRRPPARQSTASNGCFSSRVPEADSFSSLIHISRIVPTQPHRSLDRGYAELPRMP